MPLRHLRPLVHAVSLCLFLLAFAACSVSGAKDWSGNGGAGLGLKNEDIKDPATGEPVDLVNTDYTTAVRPDSLEYDRCKVTHRCNRANAHYDVEEARYNFTKQIFPNGVQDPADLFLDFENWMSGTAGLFFDQTYLDKLDNTTVGGHFNSFDMDLIGALYLNHTCQVVINTTAINLQFFAADCGMFEFVRTSAPGAPAVRPGPGITNDRGEEQCFVWDGELVLTPLLGTEVAVFNFAHFYMGPVVDVVLTGVRALALVSRSSLALDTALVANPGELGVRAAAHANPHYVHPHLLCARRVCRALKAATSCRRMARTSMAPAVATSVCTCRPSPPAPRTWTKCKKSLRPRSRGKPLAGRFAWNTRAP